MKLILVLPVSLALLLAASPVAAEAATFFADYFTNGSTLNQPPVAPTPNSTSYQTAIGITNPAVTIPALEPGKLTIVFPVTGSVLGETFARFTNTPVALSEVGDYIDIKVVFVNASNILSGAATANSTVNVGLYNSGGVAPNQGQFQLNADGTPTPPAYSGGTEDWLGYFGRIFFSGNSSILTRPAQTPNGTTSQNQDLLFSNASGSQAFNLPSGANLGSTPSTNYIGLTNVITLGQGSTNTVYLKITLTAVGTLTISNALFIGEGTGGAVIFNQQRNATGGNLLTSGFDGLAVGWRMSGSSQGSAMSILAIEVKGQSTVVTTPPDIITQPVAVTVPSGGTCAYFVAAQGFNMTYQWHRYGTNLVNGGNISGATSDTLVISPTTAADVASGANGYYVTVTGTGGYSTNSVTNSLTLGTAKNLVWSGIGNVWDLNTTANWLDPINPAVFNYGDEVTFDDTAAGGLRVVTLTGKYLSASKVTVDSSSVYTFASASTGSFAGPGQLIYRGGNQLTIGNVNTFTGGTIISNATAYLLLQNYGGLGNGPVTLAKAGGQMEIAPSGSASVGINGNVIVEDDFAIQFDSPGTFSGVLLGSLAGTPGKVLTLNASPTNSTVNQRIRVYGANSTNNAGLLLNSPLISLAPYLGSGVQVYNGVISGDGNVIHRGGGTAVFTGQNTYTGGATPTTGTIGFGADSVGAVTSGPIGTGPLLLAPEVPNLTGSGTVLAWGGARTIANPIQFPSATNNQTLIIGGTNALTFSGLVSLNGTDGLGTLTNRQLQVANTALTTISGVISDGGFGFGFTKSGAGVLALTANNTYTGPTIITNGTLRVNGSLAAGSVTVTNGATLGGSGTIAGPVNVQATANLAPGASIGTLTVNNNLSLAGNLVIEVNRAGALSDQTVVSGTLTNAGTGTVTVTNLGAALQAGDTFTLFNKAVANGAALAVTGGGVNWTNKLAVDGTIGVLSVIPTDRTNLSFAISGNTLTLSWPPNYLGWTVQSNIVSLVATNNWFPIANSGSTTQLVITVNPARSNVFYRMRLP